MSEPFWNMTGGVRPAEPVPGLFASICASSDKHIYDKHYGPNVCARCGAHRARRRRLTPRGTAVAVFVWLLGMVFLAMLLHSIADAIVPPR